MKSSDPTVEEKRILIVLMGSVGDVARGLSIIKPISLAFPGSRIDWLVEPIAERLVESVEGLNQILVFRRDQNWFTEILKLRRLLLSNKYDLVLDLQRHFKSGLFSWLTSARQRIGFAATNAKELNWIFNTEYIEVADDTLPKIKHYHLFLKALGLEFQELSPLVEFKVTPAVCEITDLKSPYVVINLGSNWSSKDWPLDGYRKLIQEIIEEGSHIAVLTGVKKQLEIAKKLYFESRSVIDMTGKTSLNQLITVIRGARALVGPDSGPGHIAAALGVPQVTLFGPTPVSRNIPAASEGLSVFADIGCAPCSRKVCPGLGGLCMRLVSPRIVADKLFTVLDKYRA